MLSSSGTDTYAAISSAIGALKGPKHGGANLKVMHQLDYILENVEDPSNDDEVREFLRKILRKERGDGSGLIYGMGHAVYTMSDPRAQILKTHAKSLAYKKGYDEEYELLCSIERLAPQVFAEEKHGPKKVCANVRNLSFPSFCISSHLRAVKSLIRSPQKQQNRKAFFTSGHAQSVRINLFSSSRVK